MGTTPPLTDPGLTHGIRPDCLERLAREDRRTRGRILIIVRRGRAELRDRLEAMYAGFDDVAVRFDRRRHARRQDGGPFAARERRHGDRRRPLFPSQTVAWFALDYCVAW